MKMVTKGASETYGISENAYIGVRLIAFLTSLTTVATSAMRICVHLSIKYHHNMI